MDQSQAIIKELVYEKQLDRQEMDDLMKQDELEVERKLRKLWLIFFFNNLWLVLEL
ncbi:hypothetical protein RchiOBHm_Chr2g0152831 [Rosa chinensis]|uniref:Uncharacterized protein n=1 Tax=Rosa chinensis TaxID=74649 RepID=A0A2P6S0J6_ROSCH|nr:hypothetical protein RchiOBHm_Chr2g0152831 [Rosa chinensis]